jgi:isopenicillin-N epimerase
MNSFGVGLREHFLLDERLVFLNHGSFGACPKEVLEAQTVWRTRMECDPISFMMRVLPVAIRAQAEGLGALLGARGKDLVFVENATTGMNAILRGMVFEPEDEVLTFDHLYTAVDNTLDFLAKRIGFRLVRAKFELPLTNPDEIVAAVTSQITARTRIAVLDHITSFSGIVMPMEKIVAACHAKGVPVLVDGAHAPGMLDLDIERVGADYYVGNCHKWLWAPKGCAFLHVQPRHQADTHPPSISNYEAQGYPTNFDWTGTKDPSAWLSTSAGLAFHRKLGGRAVAEYNHTLVVWALQMLSEALGWMLVAPMEMIGSIGTLRIPKSEGSTAEDAAALHDYLVDAHNIEVLVHAHDALYLRISAQVYNVRSDYEKLLTAIKAAQSENLC